jgi:hypothetical protein
MLHVRLEFMGESTWDPRLQFLGLGSGGKIEKMNSSGLVIDAI